MITLQYSVTKEDYVNYYSYVMWDAPERRKKRINYYIRQAIPLLVFIVAFYYTGIFERSNTFILIFLGFIFLTSFLSLFNVRSNTVRQAEKVADNPDNSSIFLDTSVIISDTGIAVKTSFSETKFQWASFIKKQENRDYYFLFINAMQALIIPKRVFVHPEEKAQFEKMLSQHLSFDAELGHLVKS